MDDEEYEKLLVMAKRQGLEEWLNNVRDEMDNGDYEAHELADYKFEKLLLILEHYGEDVSEWLEPERE